MESIILQQKILKIKKRDGREVIFEGPCLDSTSNVPSEKILTIIFP